MSISNAREPISETIGDVTYTVGPLAMSGLGRLQRFLDKLPYPKDTRAILDRIDARLASGVITEEEATNLRREAKAEEVTWPPEIIFDPRTRNIFMYEDDGRTEFLIAALVPRPTAEVAASISSTISIEPFMRIYAAAFAIEADGDANDPKAAAAGGDGPPPTPGADAGPASGPITAI